MTYDDLSRDIILAFKYGDRLDLAPLVVSWLCTAGGALIADTDAVVPVPMHPSRLLRRRYNQAAVLAQGLGVVADIEVVATALRRTRRTPTQSGLGRSAREKNLRRAIAPTEAARSRLAGRHLLLIDDVLTTGATATACSQALLSAGALRVDVLTLARVI
jgi:ComF family protein